MRLTCEWSNVQLTLYRLPTENIKVKRLGFVVSCARADWRRVNERLGEGRSISRASIIIFLNRMVDRGVLSFR